jgi:hypothetical protein
MKVNMYSNTGNYNFTAGHDIQSQTMLRPDGLIGPKRLEPDKEALQE